MNQKIELITVRFQDNIIVNHSHMSKIISSRVSTELGYPVDVNVIDSPNCIKNIIPDPLVNFILDTFNNSEIVYIRNK